MNRLVMATDPTGHTDQTFYDGEGKRIQVIDRNTNSTSYSYDLRARLIACRMPVDTLLALAGQP